MSRDVLGEATRALRQEPVTRDDEIGRRARERRSRETRERILEGLLERRRRRRRGLFLVPLAAILVGSTAWASGVLPAAWQALTGPPDEPPQDQPQYGQYGESPHGEPERVADTRPAPPPTALRSMAPPPMEVVSSAAPPAASTEDGAEAPTPATAPTVSSPSVSSPSVSKPSVRVAKPGAEDPAAALYRAAHDAHFAHNDPAVALARWNAYLAAAPRGRFAPEAAYNRAICLVRLGQRQAAAAALAPFADGRYGGYRQAEAKKLIAALSSPASSTQ